MSKPEETHADLRYKVEKYDGGSSFSLWKIKMESSLRLQGYWKVVNNKFPKGLDEEEKEDLDGRARGAIFISVADKVLRTISGAKTAAEAWKKLEENYSVKSLQNRLYQKQRLYNLKMKEGTTLAKHLDVFKSITMDLESLNIKIEEEDQALMLLNSLPPSYKSFKDTMLYGKDTITLENVCSCLQSRDLEDQQDEAKPDGESLVSMGKGMKRRSWSKKQSQRCYGCGKPGHFQKNCRNRQEQGKKLENSANFIDDGSSDGEVLSVCVNNSKTSWVLDSGACFHMSPHKNLFDTYERKSGRVYLGNGYALPVVGKGKIRIKMFNEIIRTLECWHVPGLRRSLISLPKLDAQGFEYRAKDGYLEVCRGSETLMRGKLDSGIYLLQGSAVQGEAAKKRLTCAREKTREKGFRTSNVKVTQKWVVKQRNASVEVVNGSCCLVMGSAAITNKGSSRVKTSKVQNSHGRARTWVNAKTKVSAAGKDIRSQESLGEEMVKASTVTKFGSGPSLGVVRAME